MRGLLRASPEARGKGQSQRGLGLPCVVFPDGQSRKVSFPSSGGQAS